jgi:ubiquinone/menaquinone biosynthesis C-methylase UbiE
MPDLFDEWPERYDQWFETPIGKLIKEYESGLLLKMLRPGQGEKILDAGSGTGVFTFDVLSRGANVIGLDLSRSMLLHSRIKLEKFPFRIVQGDMRNLPFADHSFDKAMSVTAIEFIEDARAAIHELFRVTRPGGLVVVATLNRLSPWAIRRRTATKAGHPLFRHALFRSPDEMLALSPVKGIFNTAIHFQKDDDPEDAKRIEEEGQTKGLDMGAFIVVRWERPEAI